MFLKCRLIIKQNVFQERPITPAKSKPPSERKDTVTLDASELGDLPARYTICTVQPHQFPVVGVYIDKRVVPGFKYRVRPLPGVGGDSMKLDCLFEGRALTLRSIGRGYARRFTFEADKNSLNDNMNYFWSDNRQEGYAFELEVISNNDKFTLYDANHVAQGTVEVVKIEVSFVVLFPIVFSLSFCCATHFVRIRKPSLLTYTPMQIPTG